MQTEHLLCWSGMTNTEHKTSGSNEEKYWAEFWAMKKGGIRQQMQITETRMMCAS